MSAAVPTEVERVESWRLKILLDAGYPLTQATMLAVARDVDLHQAVDLVRRDGCQPELAARILL